MQRLRVVLCSTNSSIPVSFSVCGGVGSMFSWTGTGRSSDDTSWFVIIMSPELDPTTAIHFSFSIVMVVSPSLKIKYAAVKGLAGKPALMAARSGGRLFGTVLPHLVVDGETGY